MEEVTLITVLRGTRELARAREGEVWRDLERRVDGLLDAALTEDPTDLGGGPRIVREALDTSRSDEVEAALLALGEDPTDERAAAASERLRLLETS